METLVVKPQPFLVHIPDEKLDRLRRKLEDFELPDRDIVEDAGWSYGVSLEWVKGLKKYWLEEFDWRKSEAAINRFVIRNQFFFLSRFTRIFCVGGTISRWTLTVSISTLYTRDPSIRMQFP